MNSRLEKKKLTWSLFFTHSSVNLACPPPTLCNSCLKVHGGVPTVVYIFWGSSGAKDQLPGHQRLIDCPLPESQIINPQAMNPDINVNKQTKQYNTRSKLSVFYRA